MTTEEIATTTKNVMTSAPFSDLILEKYRSLFFYALGVRFRDCESAYDTKGLKMRTNTIIMEWAGQINKRMELLEQGPFASYTTTRSTSDTTTQSENESKQVAHDDSKSKNLGLGTTEGTSNSTGSSTSHNTNTDTTTVDGKTTDTSTTTGTSTDDGTTTNTGKDTGTNNSTTTTDGTHTGTTSGSQDRTENGSTTNDSQNKNLSAGGTYFQDTPQTGAIQLGGVTGVEEIASGGVLSNSARAEITNGQYLTNATTTLNSGASHDKTTGTSSSTGRTTDSKTDKTTEHGTNVTQGTTANNSESKQVSHNEGQTSSTSNGSGTNKSTTTGNGTSEGTTSSTDANTSTTKNKNLNESVSENISEAVHTGSDRGKTQNVSVVESATYTLEAMQIFTAVLEPVWDVFRKELFVQMYIMQEGLNKWQHNT